MKNRQSAFLLWNSPESARAVDDFYWHRAKIDAPAFKDAIVNLKSMNHGMASGHFAEKIYIPYAKSPLTCGPKGSCVQITSGNWRPFKIIS